MQHQNLIFIPSNTDLIEGYLRPSDVASSGSQSLKLEK